MRNLLPFIPSELFLVLLVGAGLAMVIGQRQWAATLVGVVLAGVFLPVLVEPLFDAMPSWLLVLLTGVLVAGLVHQAIRLLLGREVASQAIGHVVGHLLLTALAAPFRFASWIGRVLFSGR